MNARKTLLRKTGKAIADFDMIRAGDRIAVGVSGGKDSLALADALLQLRRRSPVSFSLRAFTIEQGKFVRPVEPVGRAAFRARDRVDVLCGRASLKLLEEQPAHGCDTCSRFRRRAVYDVASKLGCTWSRWAIPRTTSASPCYATPSSQAA